MKPRAMVVQAAGSNRDLEAAQALDLAGAQAEIVPLQDLRARCRRLADYHMLVLPGGFSYADALGAGKLLALDLNSDLAEQVRVFVDSGKPVLGICNGFQALLKAGLLAKPSATLTFNHSGHFECRWVTLAPRSRQCIWTRGLTESLYCPVAHGEGNFVAADEATLSELAASGQVALTYARPDGLPADGAYPYNPNGSAADIAGLCNSAGNVLGLMPHPENHLFSYQHPRWTRGESGGLGLRLFQEGVKYAAQF